MGDGQGLEAVRGHARPRVDLPGRPDGDELQEHVGEKRGPRRRGRAPELDGELRQAPIVRRHRVPRVHGARVVRVERSAPPVVLFAEESFHGAVRPEGGRGEGHEPTAGRHGRFRRREGIHV